MSAAAAAVVVVTLLPLVYLTERALARGPGFVATELVATRTVTLVGRSLVLVGAVTAACVVLGTGLALLLTRTDLPGRRWLAVAAALPLAMPSYLLAQLWVSAAPAVSGFWGSWLVLTLVSYPYVLLTAMAALRRVDPAHEEVARALGHGSWSVLARVTLRQIRPAVAAGGLLVALYALSDFGAVAAMRHEVFTWVIFGSYRSGFNPARAAVLSLVLLAFALALVVAEARARGRAAAARLGGGAARPAPVGRLGRWTPVAFAVPAVVLVAALVVPLGVLGRWLLSAGPRWDGDRLLAALGATLGYSSLGALACVVAALPVGVLAARYRNRLSRGLEGATYLAHGLPGVVIAIAMVSVGVAVLRPWYQGPQLLVLAYVVLLVPLAVGSVRAAVEAASPGLEEVARSLGRSGPRAFAEVTARGAAPAVAAGAALVLLTCAKELPVTLLLHPTGTDTLATRLWSLNVVSDHAAAAPYALALLLIAAVPTALLGAAGAGSGGGRG